MTSRSFFAMPVLCRIIGRCVNDKKSEKKLILVNKYKKILDNIRYYSYIIYMRMIENNQGEAKMKEFTTENTEEFTSEQLAKMNERYETEIENLDENDFNYENEKQNIAEKICDDFG